MTAGSTYDIEVFSLFGILQWKMCKPNMVKCSLAHSVFVYVASLFYQ